MQLSQIVLCLTFMSCAFAMFARPAAKAIFKGSYPITKTNSYRFRNPLNFKQSKKSMYSAIRSQNAGKVKSILAKYDEDSPLAETLQSLAVSIARDSPKNSWVLDFLLDLGVTPNVEHQILQIKRATKKQKQLARE